MPVAAFRLTGSVSGFHDSSLLSVMGGESGRAQSPAPSMARERLCLCARRTALDGAHETDDASVV